MGFVGVNGTQLKITSRFSQDDDNDFFMHYMLQKVFSINLFDLKYSSGNNGELDLLMFSFPLLLKKALAQGLFKIYKTFKRHDSNVKGVIDINRHIRFNYPFNGNVAYNSRERTFDNSITQLIRHTIEYIKSKPYGKDILNCDLETKECVSEILESTSSYNVHEREKIISENLKPVNHPYFTAYKLLQKLFFILLIILCFSFTSCIDYVQSITYKDGKYEIYYKVTLSKVLFAMMDENPESIFEDFGDDMDLPENITLNPVETDLEVGAEINMSINPKTTDEIEKSFLILV